MATPVAFDELSYTVDEDSILRVTAPNTGVLDNDTDADGDALAAFMKTFPSNPLFSFKTNGTFTYDARYHGELKVDGSGNLDSSGTTTLTDGFDSLAEGATIFDSYTYFVTDGQSTDEGEVKITITGVNDDPLAVDDFDTFDQESDTVITIDALANDTDVDIYPVADTLTLTGVADIADEPGPAGGSDSDLVSGDSIVTAEGGTVTFNGSAFEYVAAAGFFGIDSFEYTVEDQNGGSDTGVVTVTVLPGNDAPVAVDDSRMVDESDGATALASVLGNDTDADGDTLGAILSDPIATALRRVDALGNTIAGSTGILVDFNADGTFSYNPNGEFESLGAGESAYVAFDYMAFDGNGDMSEATVTIKIKGENDPPNPGNPPDGTVYEAGLANGSGDGTTTIFWDFDFDLTDPDSTPFLAFNAAGTDTSNQTDTYGVWSIVDADTVRYTLTTNAPHADVEGHNGGIADTIGVYIIDGTTSILRNIEAGIVDDINFLGTLPNSLPGADTVDDTTLNFTINATSMDTFTHIQGADGATIEVIGIPDTFSLTDGRTVTSAVTTIGGDPAVVGTDSNGNAFYQIVFDPESATDQGKYTFTLLQSPPVVINDLDFSALKAGGPEENPIVENIGFNGGFFTDGGDIEGTFSDPGGSTTSDDINPNNSGGIGIGNGNIERGEALEIDVSASSSNVSGIEFDIEGVGGGIGEGKVLWEAYNGTTFVDSGFFLVDLTNTNGAHTLLVEPSGTFTTLYVALDLDDFDSNDKARINRIATQEDQLADDIILGFDIRSNEGTVDGDTTARDTFDVTIDGLGTGTPTELDIIDLLV
jgi:VCBS repeat-containing protein